MFRTWLIYVDERVNLGGTYFAGDSISCIEKTYDELFPAEADSYDERRIRGWRTGSGEGGVITIDGHDYNDDL